MSFEVSHKSPEAFRTISEVAEALDLPQHVLRFWETRFSHVHPLKRAGNRRYYRPEDVDLLRGISKLLYGEGLTIKGVQKILREQGVRYVAEIGRGETDFMTPIKPPHLTAIRENEYGLGDLAALHLEFAEQAEAIRLLGHGEIEDDASNVRSLEVERARRRLTAEQRARLEELLAELLAMKARLMAAKARGYPIAVTEADAMTVLSETSAVIADADISAASEPTDTFQFSGHFAGEPYEAPLAVDPPADEEPAMDDDEAGPAPTRSAMG